VLLKLVHDACFPAGLLAFKASGTRCWFYC